MITYGAKLISAYNETSNTLIDVINSDYDIDKVRDLISAIGSKTEIFIKSAVFPAKNARNNFASFIDELSNNGISVNCVQALHDLRTLYNECKHDPRCDVKCFDSYGTVLAAKSAIEEIISNNLGASNDAIKSPVKDIFWVAGWDHLTSGEVEVHVMLPFEYNPNSVGFRSHDMINIDWKGWDELKKDLINCGALYPSVGIIDERILAKFAAEGEYIETFIYEGEYSILITTLATYEKVVPLLPGLSRQDDFTNMLQAFLLAFVDVAKSSTATELEKIANEILSRAISRYAVPIDYRHNDELSNKLAKTYLNIPTDKLNSVSGLKWSETKVYDAYKTRALCIDEELAYIIDSTCAVRILR